MKFIDPHVHFNLEPLSKNFEFYYNKSKEEGVDKFINIGIDYETSLLAIEQAKQKEDIYIAVGYHPHDSEKYNKDKLISLLNEPKVIAIGEIGLDYYRNYSTKNIQLKAFEEQLKIAIEYDKYVIIHTREATKDTWEILNKYKDKLKGGILHCFAGDVDFALDLIKSDFKVAVCGNITYNKKLQKAVLSIPIESLIIETDSPFLTPEPIRKKNRVNYSGNLLYTLKFLADLLKIEEEKLADILYKNTLQFFLN